MPEIEKYEHPRPLDPDRIGRERSNTLRVRAFSGNAGGRLVEYLLAECGKLERKDPHETAAKTIANIAGAIKAIKGDKTIYVDGIGVSHCMASDASNPDPERMVRQIRINIPTISAGRNKYSTKYDFPLVNALVRALRDPKGTSVIQQSAREANIGHIKVVLKGPTKGVYVIPLIAEWRNPSPQGVPIDR